MDVVPGPEDEAKTRGKGVKLLRSFFCDAAAEMGEGINVLVELSEIQRSLEERAMKKQCCA